MAYNFTVESSTLIVTLDTQSGAYEPQILTLKAGAGWVYQQILAVV